ncbi:hypothetical protein [Streptomyces geranii]|uniref:hypothetical protein n=1 Tax=Streptomyces geranii TaxID=2058923 RepID=UPI000D02F0D4|nr:hypothetical protein [Streptomyces geranii]
MSLTDTTALPEQGARVQRTSPTHTLTQSKRDEQVAKTLEVLHALSGYAPDPEQDRAADDELTRRLGSAA